MLDGPVFTIDIVEPGQKSPVAGSSRKRAATLQLLVELLVDAPQSKASLAIEIQLVRLLERNGYDVSYQADLDTDRDPRRSLRHRLVITASHDEYWTKTIRDAFDVARDRRINLAFGANVGFWHMRYENNRHTIVEYRDWKGDPILDSALETVPSTRSHHRDRNVNARRRVADFDRARCHYAPRNCSCSSASIAAPQRLARLSLEVPF